MITITIYFGMVSALRPFLFRFYADAKGNGGCCGEHFSCGFTQIFVSGQHTSPLAALQSLALLHNTPGFVGSRHASASGQPAMGGITEH